MTATSNFRKIIFYNLYSFITVKLRTYCTCTVIEMSPEGRKLVRFYTTIEMVHRLIFE